MTVQEAIAKWVDDYQEQQFKLRVAGSILSLIGSLIVLFLTWWILYGILWFAFTEITGTGWGLFGSTWAAIILLFVAYLTANYEELEQLHLGSSTQSHKVKYVAKFTGQRMLSLFANPDTFRSFVKLLSVTVLAGPALLMTGVRLAQTARAIQQLDGRFVAPFLIQLAKAGKRVPMTKLAERLEERPIADLITQMSLIDGVVIRTEQNAGMYLTEDLKSALAQARDRIRKKADQTT